MYRSTTKKFFSLTAGHCTAGWEGAWTGSSFSASLPFQVNPYAFTATNAAYTSFTRLVGTNVGYGDSLCPSSYPSHRLGTCGPGTVEYAAAGTYPGDLGVLRTARSEPYVWTSSKHLVPVYYTQARSSVPGYASVCASGQSTTTFCGLAASQPDTTVLYCDTTACARNPTVDNVHLMKGLTRVTKSSGVCTQPGDSGGAIYVRALGPHGEHGGVRAVGILSGVSTSDYCTVFYTPVYVAQKLFHARILTIG